MRRAIPFVLLLATCAHVTPEEGPQAPLPSWPPPPARAQVRFVASLPDLRPVAPPRRSWWTRTWHFIVGVDDTPRPQAPTFERPFGVAAIADAVYVTDPDARTVQRIDWRAGRLTPIECEGRPWVMPMAVAAADGSIFVADGTAGAVIQVEHRGCRPLGEGRLQRPTGLAVAGGQLFVVDPPQHAVIVLALDGHEMRRFGSRGGGAGELHFPTSLTVLANGHLLVVDALNFRVVEYAPDGEFVAAFGDSGDGSGAFGRPKAIAVDESGRIFVSDAQNDVVLIFDAAREFQLAIGGSGSGPGDLTLPAGIAIHDRYLFVADSYNHRVGVYELLGGQP